MAPIPFVASATCILCGRHLGERTMDLDPVFGFCPACAGEIGLLPTQDLMTLSAERLDELPFGWIGLDDRGTVVTFNAYEARLTGLDPARVIGRHFFDEIAPCTAVREFAGRFHDLVARDVPAVVRFGFHFRLADGDRLVQIHLAYVPAQRQALVLVRSPDRV